MLKLQQISVHHFQNYFKLQEKQNFGKFTTNTKKKPNPRRTTCSDPPPTRKKSIVAELSSRSQLSLTTRSGIISSGYVSHNARSGDVEQDVQIVYEEPRARSKLARVFGAQEVEIEIAKHEMPQPEFARLKKTSSLGASNQAIGTTKAARLLGESDGQVEQAIKEASSTGERAFTTEEETLSQDSPKTLERKRSKPMVFMSGSDMQTLPYQAPPGLLDKKLNREAERSKMKMFSGSDARSTRSEYYESPSPSISESSEDILLTKITPKRPKNSLIRADLSNISEHSEPTMMSRESDSISSRRSKGSVKTSNEIGKTSPETVSPRDHIERKASKGKGNTKRTSQDATLHHETITPRAPLVKASKLLGEVVVHEGGARPPLSSKAAKLLGEAQDRPPESGRSSGRPSLSLEIFPQDAGSRTPPSPKSPHDTASPRPQLTSKTARFFGSGDIPPPEPGPGTRPLASSKLAKLLGEDVPDGGSGKNRRPSLSIDSVPEPASGGRSLASPKAVRLLEEEHLSEKAAGKQPMGEAGKKRERINLSHLIGSVDPSLFGPTQ